MAERFSKESIEKAVALYIEGMPAKEIARTIGCHFDNPSRWARARGLSRSRRISVTMRDRVIDLYTSGLGAVKISRLTGCPVMSVLGIAKKAGIARDKKQAGAQKSQRSKYTWGVMTPERAWVLGVIFGDGGISPAHGVVDISTEKADEDVLQNIQGILGSTNRLIRGDNIVTLRIGSQRLVKALKDDFGLDNNKCEHMQWPALSADLIPHFIRGLIDSDGCWVARKMHGRTVATFAYGSISRRFVHSLERALFASADVCPRTVRSSNNSGKRFDETCNVSKPMHSIEYGYLDSIELGFMIYRNSTPETRGDRKFKKWTELSDVPIATQWRLRHQRHRDRLRAVHR